jgi:hypothetical protein
VGRYNRKSQVDRGIDKWRTFSQVTLFENRLEKSEKQEGRKAFELLVKQIENETRRSMFSTSSSSTRATRELWAQLIIHADRFGLLCGDSFYLGKSIEELIPALIVRIQTGDLQRKVFKASIARGFGRLNNQIDQAIKSRTFKPLPSLPSIEFSKWEEAFLFYLNEELERNVTHISTKEKGKVKYYKFLVNQIMDELPEDFGRFLSESLREYIPRM